MEVRWCNMWEMCNDCLAKGTDDFTGVQAGVRITGVMLQRNPWAYPQQAKLSTYLPSIFFNLLMLRSELVVASLDMKSTSITLAAFHNTVIDTLPADCRDYTSLCMVR